MTTETPPTTARTGRRRRRWLYASASAALLSAGAFVWALGPGGPVLLSALADGRTVWRLGKLDLDGVSGASLGSLRIKRATLSDSEGIWIEAKDISIDWTPVRLLSRSATLNQASAGAVHVLRKPQLSPSRPPGRSWDVDLANIGVARIEIDAPVLGQPATFSLAGALRAHGARIDRALVDLRRLDAARDTLHLNLDRDGALNLDAELDGPAGGFFSTAFGSDREVRAVAHADGENAQGAATLVAKIGAAKFVDGAFRWTSEGWTGSGDIDLHAAPVFAPLAARTGEAIRIDGHGARGRSATFEFTAKAQDATVRAHGALGDDWRPVGAVNIAATAGRLDRLTQGLTNGAGQFDGSLTQDADVQTLSGRLVGTAIQLAGIRANVEGPLEMRTSRGLIDVDADLALSDAGGQADAVRRLTSGGHLIVKGRYDRQAQRTTIRQAALKSSALDISGDGILGEGARGLSGVWRTTNLGAFDERFSGEANGSWTAKGGGGQPIVIALDGKSSRFSTTLQPLDQMLGPTPAIVGAFGVRGAVIDVRRLAITSPKLRAAAFGRIERGETRLSFEASATGPVRIGGAQFEGVADATGAITGRLENPSLSATARLSGIDIAGLSVDRPVVTFALTPVTGGREGEIRIDGVVAGEPATATAAIRGDENSLSFSDLNVRAAGLTATGSAALAANGPSLDLSFTGRVDRLVAPLTGRVTGDAHLRPGVNGISVLSASAHLTSGRIGALALTQLDAEASGPLDSINLRASLRGAASGAPVRLDLTGAMTRHDDTIRLIVEGAGNVNGSAVATRTPFELSLTPTATTANGVFALGDGILRTSLNDENKRVRFNATMENAPIGPVLDLMGQRATGLATGTLALNGDERNLGGSMDLNLTDVLLPRRTRDPLSMQLTGKIGAGAMTLTGAATSRNGLDASFDARAPVAASARPWRIALAGEGRATWRARGPADALWGIVGSLDQSLAGQVDGAGELRFAVGKLSGEGGLSIAGGRFSDRQTGIELRDVSARVRFDDAGVRMEQFSARDLRTGTLTGTGVARGLKDGEVAIVATDIRLLDRPDAKALASGPLNLRWAADGMTLSGDLQVREATLSTPRTDAGIPQLDVVEINRPDRQYDDRQDDDRQDDDGQNVDIPATQTRDIVRTTLDLRVRAPGRVFVRDRGLDSEWSVDLRVRGTSAAPRVFGEARLIRGRFTLAGRVFDAQNGLIRFNGAPEEALINLAAEMSSPEITARLVLSGPVGDPAIELSSTPALPQDEILPQALFGRASQDLSALEAAQLAASLAQLAGQASLDLAGVARDLVGLDRLDVRETGNGLRIAGGKYLTRDVYLEVARTGIGETETQVEWRVRPKLFLISAFQPNGDRRLSVRWRREY